MATAAVTRAALGGGTSGSRVLYATPLAGEVTRPVRAGASSVVLQMQPTRIVTVAGSPATVTGLIPGNGYRIRVRAVDAAGNVSDWSEERTLSTPGGSSGAVTTQNFGAVTSGQITGLTPSTSYTVRIRATDGSGNWSDWSSSVPFTTAATGPTAVGGRARPVVRNGTVVLDVTATPPGGETIIGHSWAIVGGGAGSLTNATTATPTYTAPGSGSGVVTVRDTVTASGGGSATADVLVSYGATIVGAENALTGTPRATWDLSSPNFGGVSTLQGFCDGFTINRTGTASFKIAQSDGAGWTAEVFRLGYYNGDGARSYGTVTPTGPQLTASQSQPAPGDADAVTTKLSADAGNWSTTLTWTPPAWAPSGIYVLRLNRTGGGASHVMFIVRDDARAANLMFMPADSTWNAYNAWGGMGGDQYTGNSLYYGTPVDQYNADCARFVSYNRPVVNRGAADVGRSYGAVEWSTFFTSEYGMLRFIERNGIDVKYYGCIDAGGDPTGTHLKGGSGRGVCNAAIFVGHNEYWSDAMRSGWEAARDAGVSIFSCAGNEVFWRTVGSSPDSDGRPRIIECYKSTIGSRASTGRTQWTGTWRDPDGAGKGGNAPENAFTGTIFTVNGPNLKALVVPFAGGYSAQPLWRNTSVASLTTGQQYTSGSQILGFEWDTYGPAGTDSTSANFMAAPHPRTRYCSDATYAVSGDLLTDAGDVYGSGNATHRLVVYPGGAGAIVFGVGTVNWPFGVDDANTYQQGTDNTSSVIQQATLNILTDMGAPPTTLMSGLTQPSPVTWFADVAASLPITATLAATATRSTPGSGGLAVTATLTTAGTTTRPAAASLAATATLIAAPARSAPAAASLVATATLAATTARTAPTTAALAVTATLTAAATTSSAAGADAALAVTATLTAGSVNEATIGVALTLTATLTAAPARSAVVAASLPVTATLATASTATRHAAAALPVTATLTVSPLGDSTAQASLAAAATLAAGALRQALPVAALPVAATLAAGAARTATSSAALVVTAALTADAVVGAAPLPIGASLAISASITTAAGRSAAGSASLPAVATLTATMVLAPARAAASLAVTVTLTTEGLAFGTRTAGAALAVLAVLTASLTTDSDVRQFVVVDSRARLRNLAEPGPTRIRTTS
jgi:hypothetical protein